MSLLSTICFFAFVWAHEATGTFVGFRSAEARPFAERKATKVQAKTNRPGPERVRTRPNGLTVGCAAAQPGAHG
jgi:hypothetical protein